MTVATQVKRGNVIKMDGNLFTIIGLTHITPGKGNAVVQAELRNLMTGVKTQKRFRSSEDLETVDVINRSMQFLYSEGDVYHFMDQESFEQYELNPDVLGDAVYYIIPEKNYEVAVYEEKPIGIELPPHSVLKITETDPAIKGVQGKTKPATLETGLTVKVPLFIEEGELIVVNTETNDYIERAKS